MDCLDLIPKCKISGRRRSYGDQSAFRIGVRLFEALPLKILIPAECLIDESVQREFVELEESLSINRSFKPRNQPDCIGFVRLPSPRRYCIGHEMPFVG